MSGRARFNKAKVLVLGASAVGKTAFVVRYLTKRFIGEYDTNKEAMYNYRTSLERDEVALDLLDTAHDCDESALEQHIKWADGYVMLYSITDRTSFSRISYYHSLINHVTRHHDLDSLPMVVVANMADLEHVRAVAPAEGDALAARLECPHFCLSVADSPDGVSEVMTSLMKQMKREFLKALVGLGKKESPFDNVKRVFKRKIYRSRSDTLQ